MVKQFTTKVPFEEMEDDKTYLVLREVYQRYDAPPCELYKGIGKEMKEEIIKWYGWELEDFEENENINTQQDLLKKLNDFNGDGWDWVEVYLYE